MITVTSRRYLEAVALVLLSAMIATGCSGKTPPRLVPVTGKVTQGGQPVIAGAIYFVPAETNNFKDDEPSSLLALDGGFVMKTFPFGEGVAPGKYKVMLGAEVASRIKKPNYSSAEKTPWEITVPDDGVQDQHFEVQ